MSGTTTPLPQGQDHAGSLEPVDRSAPPASLPPPWVSSPLCLETVPRREALLDLGLIWVVTDLVPQGTKLVAALGGVDVNHQWSVKDIPIATIQSWMRLFTAVAVLAYLMLRHRLSPASFGLRSYRPAAQLFWGVVLFPLLCAWQHLGALIFGSWAVDLPRSGLESKPVSILDCVPQGEWVTLLLILVPAAVMEELIFRGLLLPYLRRAVGSWRMAVLASAGLFAIGHAYQGWTGVTAALWSGVLWALVFIRSRSLPTVIVMHVLWNVWVNVLRWR
jgi:membrane protease YdiL (CAAX protease family)